ncbi:AF4/FMR2 family member 2 isoform X2 [Syngnathoides biaculeatus]|uniref:AF4/FMR2 family member 2 isoform X2 n=1 Tax=Syngnathoides biaculeatus TaxID=300417 RepID=UPI002ADDA358|nr:AF4/FMR2 family member 2 isoform X2 [Syngnathoides biaculeatus]
MDIMRTARLLWLNQQKGLFASLPDQQQLASCDCYSSLKVASTTQHHKLLRSKLPQNAFCHLESERSVLKRREWERRTQEVQQDEDLYSTGFNLFGEPYKTNKGDALASRVQNTLGSYEEMKDLLTSHSNQSHLVGIPKGSSVNNNTLQTATTSASERATMDSQLFTETLNGGPGVEGGGFEGAGEKKIANASSASSNSLKPPASTTTSSSAQTLPHQNSKKSRSSAERAKGGHPQSAPATGVHLGLEQGQSQAPGAANERGKVSMFEEQQLQRHDELFSSLKDELGLKRDLSPSSSSSSSSSSTSSRRRHSSHPTKTLPLLDGNYRSSTMDAGHCKSSGSPLVIEASSHLSSSSSPLASTSLLSAPVPGLTTPTSTFPVGGLSGKPMAVQQKPTAYVRPMDGQDQAPIDSPQLKPLPVAPEGFSCAPTFGGNSGNMKNKLPKLSLSHTTEVNLPNDSSCVEEILREMTHSWPPPLTAIHTPGKADQTKFPIPSKELQHMTLSYNTQKRCTVSASKPAAKPTTAPQKSMLEDDLKISSDEEEAEQQVSNKPKARATAVSGASGSSSESESSSESDTDESESSSSDSEYNQATRTNSPEPEPSSTNKWQLDSWLNKVQAQTKPLVAPQQDHHGAGSVTQNQQTFPQHSEAAGAAATPKAKPCGSSGVALPTAPTVEHKDSRGAFCPSREKTKAKLAQKASGEGQRSKMRLSPGVMSGPEVATPRRTTTGKKQPRRTERSNSVEDNQSQTWSRSTQQSPAVREKDLYPPPSVEHQNASRPRTKPPSGKTAPRKEPRSSTNSNNAVPQPVPLQQTTVPIPTVNVNQDKRKHRGPSSKITPKSREFVETDSSSSSSECQSDSEDALKISALPLQSTRTAISTQPQSNSYTPPRPCVGSAGSTGSLGVFGGKGVCVRDGGSSVTTNINSSTSSISNGGSGGSSTANTLSIINISGSFGTSVPDPGGLGGLYKNPESMSPHFNAGQDFPFSPLVEYQETRSLWVKIDLSLLNRLPGQGFGRVSKVGIKEQDGIERRGCERPGERVTVADRERQKQDDREWQGLRDRPKLPKGEQQNEKNEPLVQDTERQCDGNRLTERDRQADREERERFNLGERDKVTERREKACQGLRVLDNPLVQDKSLPRLPGRTERGESGGKHRRQANGGAVVPTEKRTSKSKRKHKLEHMEPSASTNKKLQLDKDCQLLPPCISPIHNHKNSSMESLNRKQSRRQDEKLLPPLLSPLSEEPPHKRTCENSLSLSQDGGATSAVPCPVASSAHRHRRGESRALSHARNAATSLTDHHKKKPFGSHANGQSDSDAWSEPVTEPGEPSRPRLSFSDTVHSADYYMQEAKRLKHKADALMDKFGKAVNYADGALSFIECGNAMERDPLEAKSPYTMYSETVELIRYAMRLKNFTSHSATIAEKKLAVLCNRCLSLLYLRMFHLKKDHAVKYSRSLMEYFKNSAKSSHQAPSPWRTNGKINGTPSPLSLSLSPASGGVGGGAFGGAANSSGSVAIPQRIHHMAASHVNITNNILRSYEHWETADRLATGSQEFFQGLDSLMEPLSQQSGMTELVRYIRQGLHWLRIEAHLL